MTKPSLSQKLTKEQFENFYWLKSELIEFCSRHNLSASGSKQALVERITVFLETGQRIKHEPKQSSAQRDSDKEITWNTPVVNYKNDAKTREFFVKHIGKRFKFNNYLRQFTNPKNITSNLTYGDLVNGWMTGIDETNQIGKQFEYNQFIRDYFANEHGKSLQDAIHAWKKVSSIEGPNTYEFFKSKF